MIMVLEVWFIFPWRTNMMKRSLTVIFSLLILLILSCKDKTPTTSTKVIQGSGTLITELRLLGSFHSVDLTTAGTVNITFGPAQEMSVTVNDNILEYITTIVNNGKLTIGIESGVQVSNLDLTVNISMPDLERLSLSGAGTIIGNNKFIGDSVSLTSTGAGEIRLQLEVDQLGSSLTGAGEIFVSGKARQHQIQISGAGTIHAFDLLTETTTVNVTGVGNVEVNVSQLLDVNISGAGSVYYKGYPTITQNITGTGSIIDAN